MAAITWLFRSHASRHAHWARSRIDRIGARISPDGRNAFPHPKKKSTPMATRRWHEMPHGQPSVTPSLVDRLLRDYQQPGGAPQRKALERKCTGLHEHLAMTFQRFLDDADERARNLSIVLNGQPVDPWDPFQRDLSDLVAEDSMSVVLEDDGKESEAEFLIRAFILPRRADFPTEERAKDAKLGSNRQGLYVYREQRLINAGSFGHPEQDRAISVREAACLQTFPMDFRFSGSPTSKARQIGNAVPVSLATVVGHHVAKHLAEAGLT